MEQINQEIDLRVITPFIVPNGTAIGINDQQQVSLVFFQIVDNSQKPIVANSVAALQLNIEQLEHLQNAVTNTLEELKKNEVKTDSTK